MTYQVYNRTQGKMLMLARKAGNVLERLVGFIGTPPDSANSAVWLFPCNAVHTWGMRFSLDLIFLDRDGKAVAKFTGRKPFSMPVACRKAHSVLEIKNASWNPEDIENGDFLEFVKQG